MQYQVLGARDSPAAFLRSRRGRDVVQVVARIGFAVR